ncbi:tRNA (adenine(22)-N(1))-methyltransferase [Caminicella sporogenes]|uniref:tRNA (adenine(22)-N(1))-methyltransferase n=1 Tax=Caminicella sporogenes TaxID=166485 RepID=UPI002540288F|nr:class I SAM-dependent methyltransferase [Caminicella sporogenes]WIF94779.1 class I SAM-dependent methyltransferase [Caminicella sporogenes]
MKLSPRLQTIADLVPKDTVVGDIGTDHGYIPVYLVQNKITNKVIATDINEGPLDNAKKTIEMYNLSEFIETRLGSGLKPFKCNEIQTAIIAGMGGLLIGKILEESFDIAKTIDTLILQPMVAQDELRKWLMENGFNITYEKLARENEKMYEILVVTKGKMNMEDKIYFEVGKKLIENKDPLLKDFIDMKIKKYNQILKMVERENSINAKSKMAECREKIKKFEELKRCL